MSNIVIHNHSNRNYVALSIAHLRDTSLSWQAMGMLSFMLSCREDFKLSIEGLHKCSSCGDAATRSALKELRDKRYVIVSPVKLGGRIMAWNYDVYETPHVENPDVENPHVENQAQSNNIIEDITSTKVEVPILDNNPTLFNNGVSTIPPIVPQKTKHFVKPTLEQVTAYCNERHNSVDPQRFIDFYESKGWMVGSNHMKDWKAAVRTWEAKEVKRTNPHEHGHTNECDGATDSANKRRERDYSKRF